MAGYEVLTNRRQALGLTTTPFRNPAKLTFETINPHTMGIINAGISAMVGANRRGYRLEAWLLDMDIRGLLKRDELFWPMEPDAVMVLSNNGNKRAFFIEVDRGTESGQSPRANSWSSKTDRYGTYFKALHQTDPWLKHIPRPDVMVVTKGHQRLLNLMGVTRKSEGRSAYWFTTSELLEPPYNFFGEVWQRIGLDGYFSPTERFSY
jgi:hypothetical protein